MPSRTKIKIPPFFLRLALVLLGLAVVAALAIPRGEAFVAEAECSKALSKGRVLLRGAQLVATQRLVAGESARQTQDYLTAPGHLEEIAKAAGYPVEAVAITQVTLDSKGLIEDFQCSLDYEQRRYELTFDLPGQKATAVPQLQEKGGE